MKILFLGNHSVGVRALKVIGERAEVVGVVAHPLDPEEGVRYESIFNFASQNGWKTVRGKGKDVETFEFVAKAKPDLLWITDFRYLIPKQLIELAPLGAVNLHPSLLPKYRGRAPVNWAILNNETTLGLTAHFVDEGMDSGDIIDQVSYKIREDQDVGDCLKILFPIYTSMTDRILRYFESGCVPRILQDHSRATACRARKPEDGLIDWKLSARAIFNLVRAVAAPYPGAFTNINGDKLTVWKARIVAEKGTALAPGCVISASQKDIHVQCGTGVLGITESEGGPRAELKAFQMVS